MQRRGVNFRQVATIIMSNRVLGEVFANNAFNRCKRGMRVRMPFSVLPGVATEMAQYGQSRSSFR